MRKIKILYIIDKLDIAGAQRHLVELIRDIDKDTFQPLICCLLYEGALADDFKKLGIKIINLGLKKVYGIKGIVALFKLANFIKNEHFDIVQTYLFSANIFGVLAAKLAGTKLVISCRRDTGMLREGKFRHILAYKLINHWVDKIVCVSEAVKKVVLTKEKVNPQKVEVIYNGVDTEKFKIQNSKFKIKESLGIREDEFVVGIIGSLSWIKGHREFVGATLGVLKEIPNTKFLLVGDGPLKNSLWSMVNSLGLKDKILFLGKRYDIPDLLSTMDISVNASYSEGMSNTILESMAAGVPVVATAVDGNLETVKSLKNNYIDEEVTGILIPAKNSGAMVEAIVRILKDKTLARIMRENAKRLVQEKFTSVIMSENIEKLYRQLLRHKIAYILSQFPQTYETFILREIRSLEDRGVDIKIFSLKPCRDKVIHLEARELMRQTVYAKAYILWLIIYGLRHPIKTISSFLYVFKSYIKNPKELIKALYVWIECFSLIKFVKKEKISHIHSHWATMPTTCAMILSKLTGAPFSFTAHAWDIFVNSDSLGEKIQKAKFIITCTNYNRDFLNSFCKNNSAKKIYLNYHGIELNKFPIRKLTIENGKLKILSIGRLVQTKGFEYLIDACHILKEKGIDFECFIVGEGNLKKKLYLKTKKQQLTTNIKFLGVQTQDKIKELYLQADCFVLPCVIAKNGDRDGIPNVILEAMAIGVPVISTDVSGIPEAIINRKTGILVPQKDSVALADAIERLWHNFSLRETIIQNARQLVRDRFDTEKNVNELISIFQEKHILNKCYPFGNKEVTTNSNVLYVIWSLGLGGAERVVTNLAKGLDKTRFNPIVCCLNDKGELADELEKNGIKVIALNKNGKSDVSVLFKLISVIKQYKIDIVHTHLWGANFWGRIAARLSKVRVIIATEHSIDFWKQWYYRLFDKILYRFTDKIITVSRAVKDFYVDKVGLREDKIEVIYNGIDVKNDYIDTKNDYTDLKRELEIYDGVPVITNIGRLISVKAQSDFIEALKILNDKKLNFKAIIVGDGLERESLKFKVKNLKLEDKVIFTGTRKDILDILAISNILVSSSLREGLSLTIMEAMAVGVPVVATDVGGNRELITDQCSGFLIKPRDTKAMAETITQLLVNKELINNIRETAKNSIKDLFSLEKMIDKHQDLYSNLLNKKVERG